MKKIPSPQIIARGLLIFIILLLFLSIGYIIWGSLRQNDGGYTAEIYQDGRLIHTIALSDVSVPRTLTISGEDGAVNIVQIQADGICMLDADCPDRLCVHQGTIKNDLLPIVCLPHHVIVRLVPNDKAASLDAVTY